MPVIDIHHPHSLGKQACRARVDAIARELATRFGLDGMTWNDDTIGFAGRGVEGNLGVGETGVHVQVQLGPLPSLLRPFVEAEIRSRLREHLG